MSNYAYTPRTDLACEAVAEERSTPGVSFNKYKKDDFDVLIMNIENSEGSDATGKEIGTYYTVFTGETHHLTDEKRDILVSILSDVINHAVSSSANKDISTDKDVTLLVVGLGNRHLTADAVGPLVSEKLTVTRDLKYANKDLYNRLGCASVSTIAPGVSAETGIEAADIIKGAGNAISADVVILVDALAARSCFRLAKTIQITDTGISPGSGIGNRRTPITKDSIGIPIISIGVPTIVDSSSLVYDALESGGIDLTDINDKLYAVLENGRSFFVSPKDSDIIVESMASVIADAIDRLVGF